MRGKKGFTSVYLLMILGTLVMAVVMIINAACGHAARSIVDSVCALAGRSVLSEYQKDLYERYGVFALRGDDALLTRLARFYISGSLLVPKALVMPVPYKISASSEAHPGLDVEAFGKQIKRLAPGAVLTKGKLLDFILDSSASDDTGSVSEILPSDGPGEAVEDISKSAENSFRRDKDRNRGNKIPSKTARKLPSRLLGYPKRRSLLLSGGIFDISLSAILEDEYIVAICSNAVNTRDDTFLECEAEYILFGNESDSKNLKSLKLSLFALRFAVNEVKYLFETGELLAATAASVALAVSEVRLLLSGGKVDKLDYEIYLRILLALAPRKEKLARLMDIMELNISHLGGANFAFRNYAYGFDLNAEFILKRRSGSVEQTFVYR